MLRKLAKHLPPIAWRDEQLRALRGKITRLEAQVVKLGGSVPSRVALPTDEIAVSHVRRSALFDEDWYVSQLYEPLPAGVDPVHHYVTHGHGLGLSPHPAFVGEWYVRQLGAKVSAAPLVHYLEFGAARGISPHPAFDAEAYLADHPDSGDHPDGPIGHFLAGHGGGDQTSSFVQDSQTAAEPMSPKSFVTAARVAAEAVRDARGFHHLERDATTFDIDAEGRFKDSLRDVQLPADPPTISVVLPTKDRAEIVLAAVESVLNQTYEHWQLLIVDDGSVDDTEGRLAPYLEDERVTLLRHPQSRGVSAARNTGIAAAEGDYVAYLDSDNTWRSDFLELMVRFMHRDGHRVAYAMSALIEQGGEGRRLYRGMPFSREALQERNYIDCIVLVHDRSLLEQVGGFDEGLRRNVDWDLFIRLVEVTDFAFAPFIATEYDVWDQREERVTTDEAVSYRYLVRQRALLDWKTLRTGPTRRQDLMSAVVVATGSASEAIGTVRRVRETASGPLEVVVVDSRLTEADGLALAFAFAGDEGVVVHRLTQPLPMEVARNVGASLSSGAVIAFLPESAWCEPAWDLPLVAALESHVAVQPVVLNPGGSVWSAGASFLSGGHTVLLYKGFAGDAPELRSTRQVPAVTAICMAVKAAPFLAVEGFDPLFVRHHAGPDLSLRMSRHLGGTAACVGASVVALRNEPPTPTKSATLMAARDNDRRVRARWGTPQGDAREQAARDGYEVAGFVRQSNTQIDAVPILTHARPERPLRWALKIGPPNVERRTNWGDWHFALALRDSLERLGHEVTIDCKEEWYRPSAYLDDVVVVLRGVSVYEVNPAHTNVAWVISHPERVSTSEMADYDLVFSGSPRWCRRVRSKLRVPVEELLQCTDHRRFHPVDPDHRRAHSVLVVANARGVRPSVAAALAAGVVPAVYGLRWSGLLPEGAWKGEYLPNEQLPAVYAAAGAVLNDHWDDMRQQGLLSNRLFDLAACNARVISDHLPEVQDVFGDVILTYTTPDDIPDLVATHLNESPDRRMAREQLGEHVRSVHTFDARAQTLSERVLQARAHRLAVEK